MSDTSASGTDEPTFVSVRDAAPLLDLTIWDVYELVKSGQIAHVQRKPKGKIHILASDITRWKRDQAAAALKNVSA